MQRAKVTNSFNAGRGVRSSNSALLYFMLLSKVFEDLYFFCYYSFLSRKLLKVLLLHKNVPIMDGDGHVKS